MNKKKVGLIGLSLVSIFLFVPLVQAAVPEVWFNVNTELIWKFTEDALDDTYSVIDSETCFRKLNFTEIVAGADHLNISAKFHTATEEDISTYGFEDQTIWKSSMATLNIDPIEDDDVSTKYVSLFNELDSNLIELSILPSDDQTYVLMRMSLLVDPSFFSAYLVYALIQGIGGSFISEVNGSEIVSVSNREILFTLLLDFSYEDDGHTNSITYNGNMNLTYGETSNVLLNSMTNSTLEVTAWNETSSEYDSTTAMLRYTHEIAYPTELLDDYPESGPEPFIPGYPVWILLGAITLTIIPVYVVVRKRKK